MEITKNGIKATLGLSVSKRSIQIPENFVGRIFIDIDGKVTELSRDNSTFEFTDVRANSNIGYGWSAE